MGSMFEVRSNIEWEICRTHMAIQTSKVSADQAKKIIDVEEGQFADVKATPIAPAKLTKTISGFANSDGGDLYIGISEADVTKKRSWAGFSNPEAANGHIQIFERLFPLGTDFSYEFLKCETFPGLVLHIEVHKTAAIMKASSGIIYVRRGAQNLEKTDAQDIRRLEYAKGIASFENESTNVDHQAIIRSEVIKSFIRQVVPTSTPEPWLKKQQLIRDNKTTVAGVLLFADEPQALLPKRCGIKLYRYKTRESEGSRESLDFIPKTVEGCLYDQIKSAVTETTGIIQTIPKMGEDSLESIKYPQDTLHEIITNAVLHRDYSIADDVHIRIFDNRIEVENPGRLPAHITIENILNERFARNGAIVRILNKFPDPPNKDVGEGLNTAFEAMHQLGLKEPVISEKENSVLVVIRHETLASPEVAIMEYLEKNETIRNSVARKITHIRADHQIKSIFGRMVKKGMIEQVPGTRTSNTAYRKGQLVDSTPQGQGQRLRAVIKDGRHEKAKHE
jgi:ATP-dependent DNA helicase RecG